MKATFTNLGSVAIPLSSSQGKGFVVLLEPDKPYIVDVEDVTVLNVGENPTFFEELAESVKDLIDLVLKWREKSADYGETIAVAIQNHGPNGLRVLLGSNVEEVTVNEGMAYEAVAPRYVEIRELGV